MCILDFWNMVDRINNFIGIQFNFCIFALKLLFEFLELYSFRVHSKKKDVDFSNKTYYN